MSATDLPPAGLARRRAPMRLRVARMFMLAAMLCAMLARCSVLGAQATSRQASEIDAAGRRYAAAVRQCYQEGGLKQDPSLRGRLRVALTVVPRGDVHSATVTASRVSGVSMPAVVSCVQAAARTWHFREGAFRTERVLLWYDLRAPAT